MNTEEKMALVTRNTQEIITMDELRELIEKKEKPVVYLGTSVTGRPHVGYYVWAIKLKDFLKAGFKVKLLLADLHGALDNTPWPLLEKRYEYYGIVIRGMLKSIGADLSNFEIVKGSQVQLNKDYFNDLLKLSTFTSVHEATKAASDVVKMGDNPKLSGLIYPLMQALDEEYLGVDVQYGGLDQRKILVFAREFLPHIGYRRRVEFMTPLIPGLTASGKMSSSDPNSKIDLIDSEADIKKKLNKAFCPEKETENNGVLAFAKYVIMVLKQDSKKELKIERPEKFGGNVSYKNYEELEKDYAAGKLHPMDLKAAIGKEINEMLEIVRKEMKGKEKLISQAYPQK